MPICIASPVEVRTMRTLEGRCCRNNSRIKEESRAVALPPSTCCIRCKSCDGLQSPSSSALNSCCSRCCLEAAVHLTSCSFRVSYGWPAGGIRMRSRTSVAISGDREAMMWSNLVLCMVRGSPPLAMVLQFACSPPQTTAHRESHCSPTS